MFEPENKRRAPARSLLDFAPQERPAAARSPAGDPASLIDRLQALADGQETSAGPRRTAPEPRKTEPRKIEQSAAAVEKPKRPGLFARLGGSVKALPQPASSSPDRPLIDIAVIAGSVWQLRYAVLATTFLGAVAGVLFSMSTPPVYVADSKLYIDPREVQLTDSDLSKQSLSTEAILALVDSQTQVLRSPAVLAKVATDLGLERDGEFGTQQAGSGGFSDGVKVIGEIVAPARRPVSEAAAQTTVDPRVLDKLAEAISVFRDQKTFVVTVEVKSRDAAKSALIANRLVATFLAEEQSAQSGFFQRTTEALDSRLSELRRALDEAENAVESYKAEHDIFGANGELISDKQLLALNDQVAAVRSRISDAKAKVEIVTKANADLVLSGGFPEELSSVALSELRKQYSGARAQLGSLDASLGPRHPQRLAAAQALDVARSEVTNELRRIAATNLTELERAQKAEQDLLRQLAVQKTQQVSTAGSLIELRELERKANATRTIYESFLKRASETGEEEKLTSRNIRVISPAQAPLAPSGKSRKTIAILGIVLGFMAGIGLGVLLGVVRSLRQLLSQAAAPEDVEEEPEMSVPPPQGGGDDPPRRRKSVEEPEYRFASRSEPSSHHDAASVAALSALAAREGYRPEPARPQIDPAVAHVHDELRALRSRVEDYARARSARRG
ncbi:MULTISPECIES: GumC family protein [unclassified Rhizobium]|uniref:GumC family protein n=1 Tax=unclassified Rhizobium TaxID=2613769 RepID=UPI0006F628A1|nr:MULTISPECIES: GumC family protein [unclassified Rhizobium]KQV43862.1 hypothetical protein ASC86_03445 [Rhizobium sp. Root1212]KRD38044.1 hypothetical protein ASE37_03445 [Rhizobium sp. Root268]